MGRCIPEGSTWSVYSREKQSNQRQCEAECPHLGIIATHHIPAVLISPDSELAFQDKPHTGAHLVISISDKWWGKRGCFLKSAYFSFPMARQGAEIWGKEANILAHVVTRSLLLTSEGNQVLCILPLPLLYYKILLFVSFSTIDWTQGKSIDTGTLKANTTGKRIRIL